MVPCDREQCAEPLQVAPCTTYHVQQLYKNSVEHVHSVSNVSATRSCLVVFPFNATTQGR